MNLYSRKQRWKLVLMILAALIIGVSIWYTGEIVRKIRKEERKQVRLWSKAVQKKAKLVNYTRELFSRLRREERKKVRLWAQATKKLARTDQVSDYTFVMKVVRNNTTVPVIIANEEGKVISHRNLPDTTEKDQEYLKQQMEEMKDAYPPIEIGLYGGKKQYLYYKDSKLFRDLKQVMNDLIRSFISETVVNTASVPVILTDSSREQVVAFGNIDSTIIEDPASFQERIREMESENEPIKVELGEGETHFVFYEGSWVLTQLRYYPYVQLGVIGLFLLIGYFLFSSFRKAEQNQVWLGMAKETAHQLGTPLSSLMAWLELLKAKGVEPEVTEELQKDVDRLGVITDRFSKIGSKPEMESWDVGKVLEETVGYLRTRVSKKVRVDLNKEDDEHLKGRLNKALFGWVIENLCRNAVDAMEGEGVITITVKEEGDQVLVDVTDTGKGIPGRKQKTVFEPGYTSKEFGWGLGLSLTKRIIEQYHQGRIFVKWSEPGQGTTFRIVLKK